MNNNKTSSTIILPQFVIEGILKGQKEGELGITKSTKEVMKKYKPNQK